MKRLKNQLCCSEEKWFTSYSTMLETWWRWRSLGEYDDDDDVVVAATSEDDTKDNLFIKYMIYNIPHNTISCSLKMTKTRQIRWWRCYCRRCYYDDGAKDNLFRNKTHHWTYNINMGLDVKCNLSIKRHRGTYHNITNSSEAILNTEFTWGLSEMSNLQLTQTQPQNNNNLTPATIDDTLLMLVSMV